MARRKKREKRESSIIHREICGKKKQVAKTKPDKKPTLGLNSLLPKKNVMRIVINPARAEGRRFANSAVSPKKKVEMLINQKKRGGFSA